MTVLGKQKCAERCGEAVGERYRGSPVNHLPGILGQRGLGKGWEGGEGGRCDEQAQSQ